MKVGSYTMSKDETGSSHFENIERYFNLAKDRLQSPFNFPEHKKQVVVVSNNYKLLLALNDLIDKENAQLRHARSKTPDILVFSGTVKIIDRSYLGNRDWETFCDYLEEVNSECDLPVCNENKEVLYSEPIFDDTPLIIIDDAKNNKDEYFKHPHKAKGGVYYIDQHSIELIIHLTSNLLREGSFFVSRVKAEVEI